MKIICVPYAGGSSSVFAKWKKYISPDIEIIAPELAGRGARCRESFYSSIQFAAEDIYRIVSEKNIDDRFAIFGHSMGCFIAYELYRKICGDPQLKSKLVHIFMSGNYAPHLNNNSEHHTEFYKLEAEGIKEELIRLGGTAKEIFDDPVFAQYFLPIIRSDYYITETYEPESLEKFTCGCTVYNGLEDELTPEDLESWRVYSPCGFTIKNFSGNHFFINDNCKMVVEHINKTLRKYNKTMRREYVKI